MAASEVTSHPVAAKKEVIPFGSIDLPEKFYKFAATVYKAKGYIVVTTDYSKQPSISVWDIENRQKALVQASIEAGFIPRLSTSKDGRYLARLRTDEKNMNMIEIWDLANGIEHKKLEMMGKSTIFPGDVVNFLCRTNPSDTNRPWLFLLIDHRVEVWAFEPKTKQMMKVRTISKNQVKIEDITVLDFISTKLQTEIIAMNCVEQKIHLEFFDTTGKHVKTKDVGELGQNQDPWGVTCDHTGKFVATWADKQAFLLDSNGLKTAPIRGESVFCSWFAIGQQSLLLTTDGTAFHIRQFNATKFEFGEGYSVGTSGTGPAIEGFVNTLVVGQNLLFFSRDDKDNKKILVGKLEHPEKS